MTREEMIICILISQIDPLRERMLDQPRYHISGLKTFSWSHPHLESPQETTLERHHSTTMQHIEQQCSITLNFTLSETDTNTASLFLESILTPKGSKTCLARLFLYNLSPAPFAQEINHGLRDGKFVSTAPLSNLAPGVSR